MNIFHKMWEGIKAHPYIIAGVVGVIVLYYLLTSGSSSSASSGTAGPSDAVQEATLAANAQANSDATRLAYAGIAAQSANYQVEQAANVQNAGIAANVDVSKYAIDSQTLIALANDATENQAISAAEAVQIAPYQVQMDVLDKLAAEQVHSGKHDNGPMVSALYNLLYGGITGRNANFVIGPTGGFVSQRNTPAQANPLNTLAGQAGKIVGGIATAIAAA